MSSVDKTKDGKDAKLDSGSRASTPLLGEGQQLDAEKEKETFTTKTSENGSGRELTTKEAYFASLNEWVSFRLKLARISH